jgi:hypothetical protein
VFGGTNQRVEKSTLASPSNQKLSTSATSAACCRRLRTMEWQNAATAAAATVVAAASAALRWLGMLFQCARTVDVAVAAAARRRSPSQKVAEGFLPRLLS